MNMLDFSEAKKQGRNWTPPSFERMESPKSSQESQNMDDIVYSWTGVSMCGW